MNATPKLLTSSCSFRWTHTRYLASQIYSFKQKRSHTLPQHTALELKSQFSTRAILYFNFVLFI